MQREIIIKGPVLNGTASGLLHIKPERRKRRINDI
jgi:hypothetical protein